MTSMRDLMNEASRMGIRVHLAHLDEDLLGFYDHDASEIVVGLSLTMPELKEVLAHELGHALHCHDCSNRKNERQADRYAAKLLVNSSDYAAAERIADHPALIANELGLTEKVVRDYQDYFLAGRVS